MTLPGSIPGTAQLPVVPAAGTLPWRRGAGHLEVALVHRPRYDDWSWAKGKLDPGEQEPAGAVRETLEETGLRVRLGRPLPTARYIVLDKAGRPALKQTHYWAAEVVGGSGQLEHEIDEVAWLDVVAASRRLDYARDRDQLRALVHADSAGTLGTWPLALMRHAHARPRARWTGDDQLRPLDKRGKLRAVALVPLLAAYAVHRLVSSPSVRCTATLEPYAAASGRPVKVKEGLSEEGHTAQPARAARHLAGVLDHAEPAAVCSHGPVLPALLKLLGDKACGDAVQPLRAAVDAGMAKGEVLVCHMVGSAGDARVAAVEQLLP